MPGAQSLDSLESRFTQKLDRAAFATYFVGAVVPLLALAVLTERFVLPAFGRDDWGAWTAIGGLTVVGLLSLSAFLFLRRSIHRALHRMTADKERLGKILRASEELADAPHAHVVAETVTRCAVELTGARGALLFLQNASDKSLTLCESFGDGAGCFESSQESLQELVEGAQAGRQPVILEGGRAAPAITAAAAIPFAAETGPGGVVLVLHTGSGARFAPEEVDALATLSGLARVALRSADLQDAQRNFFTHVTDILVASLDSHVDERQGHATAVAQLANLIGREMRVDDDRLQRLHFAALLHDIGMLRIPRSQHDNHVKVRQHPLLGHRMLSRIRLWGELAPIVLHHHEHFDGSGFPEGLDGRRIPLEARIIHVADAFELLVGGAGPEGRCTPQQALRRLREESGSRFDPEVLSACAAVLEPDDLTK